jgi:predicted permease
MSFWRNLFHPEEPKDDLDAEIEAHMALAIAEKRARGMSEEAARAEARREFGNVALVKDTTRGMWGGAFAEALGQDVRYALRGFRRSPGFTLTVLLTLALGLGAVTAMLAIVDSVLLRPVALPHPEQLVILRREVHGAKQYTLTFQQIGALDKHSKSFSAVSGYNSMPRPVSTADGSRIVLVARVTPNFFRMLDVRARYGRMLNDTDENAPVAVVSFSFWQERLHSDPRIVGSTIKVAGAQKTVIGVTPEGIHFGQNLDGPVVYTPFSLKRVDEELNEVNESAWSAARLKPNVSMPQALAEASSVFAHAEAKNTSESGTLQLQSYASYLTGDVQHGLLILLGGAGILLLIAYGNSANLQIARIAGRIPEMKMRSALGASARRLVQQVATESIVLSLLGALLGVGLAYGVVFAVRSAYGRQFTRFDELAVHPAVFLACGLLAVLSGAVASVAPMLSVLRQANISGNMTARTRRKSRLPGVLVVVQIALTCVLLVTSGLFARTFSALQNVKLGFDPHGVTTLVLMPENAHQSAEISRQVDARLLERLGALPGVESATMQSSIPFSHFNVTLNGDTEVNGSTYQKGDDANYSLVSTNFVQASGMHLLRGRGFLPQDDGSAAVVCVVNEAFVQKYLGGRDPLRASLRFHRNPGEKDEDMPVRGTMTVVGVVENELQGGSLGAEFYPMVYLDYRQLPDNSPMASIFSFVSEFAVRSTLPQAVLANELRAAVKQAAPQMTEMDLLPMEQAIAKSLNERRLALRLVSSFGAVALFLAAIGIYGVLAYSVAQRRREIGIRMALGSSRGRATRMVTGQAGAMVGVGLLLGGIASWPAGRAIRSFLFGVRGLDPLTLCVTVFCLLLVCAIAAAVPAWRAAQVDPMEALRSE